MRNLLCVLLLLTMVGVGEAQTGSYLVGEWQAVLYSYGYEEMTIFSIANPTDRAVVVSTFLKGVNGYVCRTDTIPAAGRVVFTTRDFGLTGEGVVQMITRVSGQVAQLNDYAQIAAWRGVGYCSGSEGGSYSVASPLCESDRLTPMTPVVLNTYTRNEMMGLLKLQCN